mmetsp:Transcript_18003/g.22037  ORF Transcript_18003/g.22037 Transcript_18003/m.22037 type:complete len:278 (-) Transcript_18003:114-947(-)
MNCKEHHLPELELATGQVREALQAILHTILFIRSPGPVTPQDVPCENFDITYTRIANHKSTALSFDNNYGTYNKYNVPATSASTSTSDHHRQQQHQDNMIDRKVDESIEKFLKNLIQIGPELLSGNLTLSFHERHTSKQLFGIINHETKITFEQWIIYLVVNNTPRPVNDDKASIMERQRIQDTAEVMLKSVFMKIYDFANGVDGLEHHSRGGGAVSGHGHGHGSNRSGGGSGGGGLDHIPPSMYEFEIRCSKRVDDRENVYSRVANMPALLNLDGA